MKTKGYLLIIAGIVLLATGLARAQGNGTDLVEACDKAINNSADDYVDSYKQGYCVGLVRGVIAMRMMCDNGEGDFSTTWLTSDWTNGQVIRIVDKYLHDHPEELDLTDYVLAARAVSGALKARKRH